MLPKRSRRLFTFQRRSVGSNYPKGEVIARQTSDAQIGKVDVTLAVGEKPPHFMPERIKYTQDERKLRKAFARLVLNVRAFEAHVDLLYAKKSASDNERGKQMAQLMNKLSFANDETLYFGLGFDHRQDKKDAGTAAKIRKLTGRMFRDV